MGLELKLPKPMKFHDDELMKFLVRQTERDVDIVFGCYNHGPLTVRQIQRWFFPNVAPNDGSQVSRRMSLLRESGDVCVLKRAGDRRHFYIAGPQFVRAYGRDVGESPGWLWRRRLKDAVRKVNSNHSILLNDVFSYFKMAENRGEGALLDWQMEPRWQFRYGGKRWLLIPDITGWWYSNRTNREIQFLLEVDTGTETLHVVTEKIFRYIRLLQRLGFARSKSGRPGFPAVIFVTRTNRRAQSLAACIPAAVQKSGIGYDDVREYATFAVSSMPLIEERGVASTIWSVPLDRSGGIRTLDELLPSNSS